MTSVYYGTKRLRRNPTLVYSEDEMFKDEFTGAPLRTKCLRMNRSQTHPRGQHV